MLADDDASVRVTWLNRVASGSTTAKASSKARYVYAYDDTINVQSILCHVFLVELNATEMELTPKSLKRVERNIGRAKAGDTDAADDADDDLHERPPTTRMQERAAARASSAGGNASSSSGRGRNGAAAAAGRSGSTKRLSKRDEALIVPPLYTTVDVAQYDDTELCGTQPFTDFQKDTFAMNREVLRAVLTKNHKLLKKLTTDATAYRSISSFATPLSVEHHVSPLQLAILADDVAAASLLLKARALGNELLAKTPTVSLPSHSTGKHTSAFSDYNRRAINASRGGKEGNKALVEDTMQGPISADTEEAKLWGSSTTSVKMLTLFHPTGDWTTSYDTTFKVARAARTGNYKFVGKVVDALLKNGGWGFNDLHAKVLSATNDDLPAFRAVSANKMASQSRIRPIHLAAINPNVKYLAAIYDAVGAEWTTAKDTSSNEPIHYAAACETTAPLAFLLERKTSLFVRNKSRETPLMRALFAMREDNVLLMLEHAAEDDDETLQKLLAERGSQSKLAIHYAAERGCARVLTKLLALGVDPNSAAGDKLTPLCFAAQRGHLACVEVLLDGGAKVDGSDKLKKTPLIYAVKNGHTRVAALLINHGANVNAYDTSENSVVHYAASYGWRSSLALLADAGADFWVRNSWGFVPLICALLQRRLSASEFILAHDTTQRFLDFRDRQGCTMLFLQCKHSTDVTQIQFLLEKGLQPDICDSEHEYPLQTLLARAARAARANASGTFATDDASTFFTESVRLLLTHGAKPHYTIERHALDKDGVVVTPSDESDAQWQPLQLAMRGGLDSLFDMLLTEFNADPAATSADGSDAWLTAATLGSRGDRFIQAMLTQHAKLHNDAPLAFAARTGSAFKRNFFHIVARNSVGDSALSPALVRQCLAKCAAPAMLMNAKDHDGYSPLITILQQERPLRIGLKGMTSAERSDKLAADHASDAKYVELVALLAEHTTSADAFTWYVTQETAQLKLTGSVSAAVAAIAEPEADVASSSASGSDNDDDEDDDDDDDDDDGSGSGSDSDDSSTAAAAAAAASKRKQKRAAHSRAKSDSDTAGAATKHALVPWETVLHLASIRKLTTTASDAARKWHGKNLVELLFSASKQTLVDAALVNVPDALHHKTALQYAVEASDLETVRVLVAHGANANASPLRCDVCTRAQFTIAPSDGTSNNSNEQCVSRCGDALVETALFAAVKRSHVAITTLLLAHGANVACVERESLNSPLHCALGANSAAITKELLARGADLSYRNARGQAPLHFAVRAKHSIPETELHQDEITYTDLSKLTATPSTVTATVSTASTAAAPTSAKTALSAIQVALQDKKASRAVVLKDSDALTPVHLAASNRDLALLRDLVKACGADAVAAMNVRDDFGRTPLHFAVNAATMSPDASFEVERFLLASGANANHVDRFGFAPLHLALLKKIFSAKTGNHWTDRHAFVKQRKKYNLVQRVNTHTEVDASVTQSFAELDNVSSR